LECAKQYVENGIENGVVNNGLYNACRNGHIDIAKLCVKNGANCFNKGLSNACCYGYIDIVKYMIDCGADECTNCKGTKHKL